MIAYHGSNRVFKNLRISSSLCRFESTKDNEGLGIYFSTDRDVCARYGRWIYVLEINDSYFVDYRIKNNCMRYVLDMRNTVLNTTGLDVATYWNIAELADRIYLGGLAVTRVGKEVMLILDSDERWHRLSDTKRKQVERILRQMDKSHKAFMFNYTIRDCGVIKDVSPEVVRILRREERFIG